MNNLKLPAYPLPLAISTDGEIKDASDWEGENKGFTKLELASLMIAQGKANSGCHEKQIAQESVLIAKAVLLEANK